MGDKEQEQMGPKKGANEMLDDDAIVEEVENAIVEISSQHEQLTADKLWELVLKRNRLGNPPSGPGFPAPASSSFKRVVMEPWSN